ncbi:ABC transporter-associated protein EcsC [Niastella yeongjuensis]|uniref:ABC transporter-associated protein EcsC n=1 Tax=Niastella yeongjuensis TaxID=354355 RepID=A0A1V9E451_9BACT|nr:EcsC family protein [Niastella yeongjuensis]OQP40900.1 ABC transporter-associated protein EcsC [Niastella yeongjuensis]SEO98419.1 EcsC protein family protein [Niastella yeongjuensis]
MTTYEQIMMQELRIWQRKMMRKPGFFNRLSKSMQDKINNLIPEKVHQVVTVVIKQMIRGVLFGAKWTTRDKKTLLTLGESDDVVEQKIKIYRTTAAAEGALTGAGGLWLGLADFPLLIAIKIKLLFEIAAIYGFSVNDYKERVYILYIFQLAFSSAKHRRNVFLEMINWDERSKSLPEDINQFEWRPFQQEYRDYIDLAKMAQLIPVIGAPVGAVVNYRLIRKLGYTAKMAYHMRWAEEQGLV